MIYSAWMVQHKGGMIGNRLVHKISIDGIPFRLGVITVLTSLLQMNALLSVKEEWESANDYA